MVHKIYPICGSHITPYLLFYELHLSSRSGCYFALHHEGMFVKRDISQFWTKPTKLPTKLVMLSYIPICPIYFHSFIHNTDVSWILWRLNFNHWHPGCLLNRSLKPITIKTTKPLITGPLWYTFDRWISLHRDSNAKSVSLSWRHHTVHSYWFRWNRGIWSHKRSGPRLNIKTVLSTYGDFHVKDKTAVRTSYL